MALAAFVPTSLPALPHDPFSAWRTLSSAHFDVHYPDDLESLAPRCAAVCERRFGELAALFRFEPKDRIQVVLADEDDEANGETSAYPYDTVLLIVAPPDDDSQMFDLDQWMDYVVSHEMTHAFHLDHARGFPGWMRHVFGRAAWTFPNYFQPPWVLEGLATWAETDPSRGVGRGQDPYFRGLMRAELEAGLKPLRRVNQPLRTWPGGSTRYVYGVYFMNYLAATDGPDSLRRWVENYSGNWIPYFINRNARKTFKKKLPALWAGFGDWLRRELGPELEAAKARGLRGAPADVDGQGGDSWGPYKGGYAVRRDGLTRPRLQRLEGRHWRDVGQAYPISFWPGPGRVLYTEDEVHRQSGLTRDLWAMDPGDGSRRRLTWGLRVQEAVEGPGGVIALIGGGGEKRLVRLEPDGGQIPLWQGSGGENLASLCLSPDGKSLAASHWRRGRGWDVEELDLASGQWTALASGPEPEIQPSYSPDGRILYFSAAYGPVFNVFALDLRSRALRQLSETIGGAFHPWPGPAGTVYCSLLTARGMVLGALPFDAAAWEAQLDAPPPGGASAASTDTAAVLSPRAGPKPYDLPPRDKPDPAPVDAVEGPYAPWPSLMPVAWYPVLQVGSDSTYIGAGISGADVLGRHQFDLAGYTGGPTGQLFGSGSYSYTRWLPQLGLQAGRDLSPQASGGGWRDQVQEQWGAFAELPWSGTWRDVGLSAGATWAHHYDGGGDPGAPALAEGDDDALTLAATYSGSTQPRRALGPVDGLEASAGITLRDPGLDDELGWLEWSLARPSSLGHGLELEAGLGGGRVTSGQGDYQLASALPPLEARQHAVAFQPRLRLDGYEGGLEALSGPAYGTAHLGLRFPLATVEWGIMAPPVGVDRVWGRVWGDSAQAYDHVGAGRGLRDSVGADLDIDWVVFYVAGLGLRAGYAHGLDPGGRDEIYVNLNAINADF